ncbi:S8 family serine peptidase [Bacillus sp. ISL-41]|uniref:S8 family serine peptidase n=1 Tax=Bacillus sp. ISL-41 TaxID=2819127 RepID=UPI001BE55A61|nr:S8 family serine peptidase [Bacillus sp. ISL-41]MBT2644626.1 S8 family serine peptidase [Bacillus sp. ISL-41]
MNRKRFRSLVVVPLAAMSLMVTSVSPALALESHPIAAIQKSEVVVVYKNTVGREKVLNQAIEVKDEFTSLKAINLVLPESAIHFLKSDPDISYIEHQVDQQVELLGTPGQWNVEAVNAPEAWSQGITGQGVKVAIIDTGIAIHNELPNVVQRVSFVEDDPATLIDESSPLDNHGHGTHVAGIVGAKIGGSISDGSELVGVAPNTNLYSLKAMDGDEGSILNVIEAIDWAIANDMDIINLSLGLSSHVQLLQDAVDRAYNAGILLVGAAGNDDVGSPVNYPAKYESVIAVSSVDYRKTLSSFSSTGAEIEFTAPGSGIASTYVNGSIAMMSGTSQAAPHIAGFLALLKQKDPTKTASELRLELQKYAEDLGPDGRDEFYGYGFIDYNTLDDVPPADVMNLQAAATTTDSITVSFTKPSDDDFVKTNLYIDGELSGETTADSYTFTGLSPDKEYHISSKTVDGHGNLSNGVSILVKTKALPDTTAPYEVTEIKAESITETSALISWTNPDDDDFVHVNLYFNGEKIKTVLKDATPSHTLTGLTPDTAYSVLIRTVDQTGNESPGKTVAFTTEASAVEDPVESPAPSDPGVQDPPESGGEEQPVNPDPSEPGTQEQPVNPVPTEPAPHPGETAPLPDTQSELLVTREKLVETNGKIELTLPSTTGKIIFSPDVWNELRIMKKDLYVSFNGLSILMPKENIANLRLEHLTEIAVSSEASAPPKGANLLTDLAKIEMVDQVTKRRINTFDKPLTITLDLPAVKSAGLTKAIFGARKAGSEWQFAGGNITSGKLVLHTRQLASFAVMENHRTFLDIKNHWAKPEIEQLASRLIIQGKTADLFSPNEEITRAQFVVLLSRMLSIPTKEYSGTFRDVPKSQTWAAVYIEAAQRHGITSGLGDGTFQPNRIITRQEMAAMIVRALRVENPDALQESSATTKPFTDDKQLSTTFKQEIYQATKAGLIKGLPDGSFNPLAKATRAQTSVVLYRALH